MDDGITFYPSFLKTVRRIKNPEEFQATVIALLEYAFEDKDLEDDQIDSLGAQGSVIYPAITPNLEASKRNRKNAKSGGRKAKTEDTDNENRGLEKNETPVTKNENPGYGKDETTKTKTKTETITETKTETDKETSSDEDVCGTVAPRIDIQPVVDEWNTLPDPVPKVLKVSATSTRAKSLRARISQYGMDDVMKAIDNIRHSPFLLGQVKDFIVTFDWFVKPNNFLKVLDGNYLEHTQSARSGTTEPDGPTEEQTVALAEHIQEVLARSGGDLI